METETNDDLIDKWGYKDLKMEIETAIGKCDELDEPQKSISKTILRTLQFMIGSRNSYTPKVENIKIENEKIPKNAQKLCKATKMNLDDLEYIFDFEDENLELVANITGESEKEKQFKATLCILTAYNFCFGKKEITSSDLVRRLEDLGIGSLSNLSPYLSKYTQFIRVDGKTRTYKIKGPGINKGKEIIRELVLQEKGEKL